jgi:predicted transglutaminase-like cysteine proteinase
MILRFTGYIVLMTAANDSRYEGKCMLKRFALTAAAVLTMVSVSATASWSFNKTTANSVQAGQAAPLQFQLYCLKNPSDCRKSKRSKVQFTASLQLTLQTVNSKVNRAIQPRRDVRDVWSASTRRGDCDDYVMTKRRRLMQAGLPASALRVAIVRTRRGEGHSILIVNTSAGELVLDNLRSGIVRSSETGYRFVSVSTADPLRWRR